VDEGVCSGQYAFQRLKMRAISSSHSLFYEKDHSQITSSNVIMGLGSRIHPNFHSRAVHHIPLSAIKGFVLSGERSSHDFH
jgi:hypothetical protein